VSITNGAHENIIGEASSTTQNIISGNGGAGVFISGEGTDKNTVRGNFIGTDLSGDQPVGNTSGVRISVEAKDNIIGGDSTPPASATNIISANLNFGVDLVGAGEGNKIQGNLIGTNKDGSCTFDTSGHCPLGNGEHGVLIDITNKTIIGRDPSQAAPTSKDGNTIAFNGRDLGIKGHGVVVQSGRATPSERTRSLPTPGVALISQSRPAPSTSLGSTTTLTLIAGRTISRTTR
jgi:hypothetical protein